MATATTTQAPRSMFGATGAQRSRSAPFDETNAVCRISLASPEQILKWASRQRRQADHFSQLTRFGEDL
ncbi:hypothetical protein IIC65_07620, partial [Candidatus Sumerlaeota bacterium]|nr:hypothetical protein [Candidatus Sumerlaeota bacterium]